MRSEHDFADNPRRDELFAKEAFSRFVASRHGTPKWEPGPRSQAPDFWLTLGERRFAVEVTQVMEPLDIGSRTTTGRGARAALDRAVRELRGGAQAAGLLRGFYHIHVCPLPDLRAVLPELQRRLFEYLQVTANSSAAERKKLWRGSRGQCWSVEKIHEGSPALAESMSLGDAKWEGEVREELPQLLAERLADKREKVRTIREEVILLLVDAYHYADSPDWLQAIGNLDASRFHTVARVFSDHDCQILSLCGR